MNNCLSTCFSKYRLKVNGKFASCATSKKKSLVDVSNTHRVVLLQKARTCPGYPEASCSVADCESGPPSQPNWCEGRDLKRCRLLRQCWGILSQHPQGPGLSCPTAYWPCPGCWCCLWIPPLSLLKTLSQESWEIGFLLLFVCGGESCLPHCHFFILSWDICSWQLVGPCSRAASREICALMAPWTLALATHQLEVTRSVYASALPIPGPLPAPVSLSCVVGS